ncbi:hypothetical protein N7456_010413 [Penicillium angulare]|uniref:Uncharacterized protein n=1 Tax=Penicillium angulare TaxID=116970 RepID=A0A9W9F6R1_9EURO|nr:hypothetical protein N7456_010413 [Penicillium angulare]
MSDLQDKPPPSYTECTQDQILDVQREAPSSASASTPPVNDAETNPLPFPPSRASQRNIPLFPFRRAPSYTFPSAPPVNDAGASQRNIPLFPFRRAPSYTFPSAPPVNDAGASQRNIPQFPFRRAPSYAFPSAPPVNDAETHPSATAPEPATVPHIPHERRRKLKNKATKVFKDGAETALVVVAAPVVMAGMVVYEGGKVVLKIVATPFALCLVCVFMDDFEY